MAEKMSIMEQLNEKRRETAALERQRMLECDHVGGKGIIPLDQYDGVVRNREKYPKTTVIHPDCGTIFDAKAFSKEDMEAAIFTLSSACHQIKMMTGSNMKEKNKENLIMIMESIEYLKTDLVPYYNSMVKALAKNNEKPQRSGRKVGGMGISSSQFA